LIRSIFRTPPHCIAALISLASCFCALNSNSAWADKVFLKGEAKPIEGKVLSVGQDEVLIQLPEGQQLPLIRQKVERVELNQPSPSPKSSVQNAPPLPESPHPSAASIQDPELRPLSNQSLETHGLEEQPVTPALLPPQPLPILQLEAESTEPQLEEVSQGTQLIMLAPSIPTKLPQFSTLTEEMFVSLSKFKGKVTQNQYAGLYNFPQRGTFWIRFPSPATEATPLQFTLFGKQHKANPKSTEVTLTPGPEAYVLEVRFLSDQGETIGKPEQVTYKPQAGQLVEWFHLLENMSGLCDPMVLAVTLPQKTKLVEFRVINGEEGARHLVGYLGQIQLGQADLLP
jgi:hypothetical protein